MHVRGTGKLPFTYVRTWYEYYYVVLVHAEPQKVSVASKIVTGRVFPIGAWDVARTKVLSQAKIFASDRHR